jgi:hypothetical protein
MSAREKDLTPDGFMATQTAQPTARPDVLTPDSFMAGQMGNPSTALTPDSFMQQQAVLPSATSKINETADFSNEDAERSSVHPFVPVVLPVSDEDTRMVEPSSWGRRAIFKVAQDRGIPEQFAREWADHQQVNGKLKTYDLQSRSPFGNTNELLKATGYDPNTKSLTLHVEAGMVDQLQRDYEESKGYFRKLKDVIDDPSAKPGAVAFQAVAPVVSGAAHVLDIATRPLQAASTAAIGLDRAVDPIVGASEVYAKGKPTNPLETLKALPGAVAHKFLTGETTPGFETPLTATVENFAGDHIPEGARPLVHTATEILGDPLTYAPFALKGLKGLSAAADVGEAASKESALKLLSEVPLHDEAAVSAAYERAAQAGIPDHHIRAALAGESVALDDLGKVSSPSLTFKENLYSALNLPRSVITAGDLSASARQGAMLSAGHPVKAAQAFVKQLKAFASEGSARQAMEAISSHPNYERLKEAGLFLPDMADSSLTVAAREEAFGSRLAKHVPLVNRSERAFNVFLNDLRFRVGSDILDSHPGMTSAELQEVSRTLNVLTGRGSLGPLNAHAADTAQILFAPRLLASRIQTPLLLASKSPVARAEAARSIISFVGANLGFLGAAKMAGADVTLDPRSSDFMRIKVGDTRIDLMAGYQAPIRYAAQLIMGQRKNVETGEVKQASRLGTAGHLLRTRLAPQLGIPLDLATGKNVAGEKVGAKDAVLSGIEYLSARDIYEAYEADKRRGGSGKRGAALGALSLLGVGVSTYHTKDATPAQKDYARSLAQKAGEQIDVDHLSAAQASAIINRLKGNN